MLVVLSKEGSSRAVSNQYDDIFMDGAFLTQLQVGIGEVASITGIPQRQIRYWESKGIIQALPEGDSKTRRYDYLQIKKMLLIKDLMDEGYSLDGAEKKLAERMAALSKVFAQLKQKH